MAQKGPGYILGDFLRTHLVSPAQDCTHRWLSNGFFRQLADPNDLLTISLGC
jgi:hypothetical protein